MTAQILPANPAQIAQLRAGAASFEQYAGQVSRVVAARWAYWNTLKREAARYGVNVAGVVGAELATAHDQADVAAGQWAGMVRQLDVGRAQLAAWTVPGELDGGQLRLGVVVAGSIPTNLSLWPIVPIIVYAAGAAISVGTWLLADAWLGARKIEAETARLQAQTQAKITQAVAAAAAQGGPDAAATVADAIAKANASAQQPTASIFDQILGGIGNLIPTTPGGVGGLALLVIGYFVLRSMNEKRTRAGEAA